MGQTPPPPPRHGLAPTIAIIIAPAPHVMVIGFNLNRMPLNAPPEDCGGIRGFYEKLDIAADPSSPEHNEIREWLGDYDPQIIDELPIKISLGRIAKRRNAAKARIKKQAT